MKQANKQKYNTNEQVEREWELYDEDKPKKGKNNLGIIVVSVCVIASAVAGSVLGRMFSKSGDKLSEESVVLQVTAEPEKSAEEPQQTEQALAEQQTEYAAIPPALQENDLINIIAEARRNGVTKRAYLTFDDGPSKTITNKVLDVLKKYNIKATFFEVGRLIKENPDVAKRVHDEGHLIANHSYSHDYNALYQTEESFSEEIKKAEQTIAEITGAPVDLKLIRFPGGSYNAGDHAAEKQVYKNTLANMGYYYCDWNTLNGDAEGKEKSSAELTEYFKKYAASFIEQDKNVIVLMHDSDSKQATVESLDGIIAYLAENEYTFHRLDEIG